MLEDQLWDLAVLVRDQDSGNGLDLNRRGRLRRLLDLRVYEILLLHVRTRLIRDGIIAHHEETGGGDVGCTVDASSGGDAGDGGEAPLTPLLMAIERAIRASGEHASD